MYDIFPLPDSGHLSQIVESIIASVSPEKIYLLAAAYQNEKSQSIFMRELVETETGSSFFLLILTKETETRLIDELQDIIEHRLGLLIPLTALVIPVHEFNGWLMKNHPFAARAYHEAKLYYDAGITPLAIPDKLYETSLSLLIKEKLVQRSKQAVEFMAGAELFALRKQYGLAAFNLHQSAEQLYSGVIQFISGLRVQTHNLDKLHRYARWLAPAITAVFPRNSNEEKEIFRWLQRAYTEGRYSGEYAVKYAVISQLTQRVKKLMEIF